eukprot:m.294295 g.294295  ORF g.294295 m.294295 type:complete len:138 (-) comp12965_c0_seq1:201-614(-)
MENLALDDAGATVVFATASDPAHPPDAAIDGDNTTFWSTTGLFPHELVVTFPSATKLTKLEVHTNGVAKISAHKSANAKPAGFEDIGDAELPNLDGPGQVHDFQIQPLVLRHLKLVLHSGHSRFAAVYKIVALGSAV